MPSRYRKIQDLPAALPLFPLDSAILLPHSALPLNIFEPRYLNMIDDALSGDRMIGMIQTIAGGNRERPNLAKVGCAGRLTSFSETGDGRYLITLTGVSRFKIGRELLVATPYRQAAPDYAPFKADLKTPDGEDDGFDRVKLLAALKTYLDKRGLDIGWETAREAPCEALVNSLAMGLPFETADKQALLEAPDGIERLACLVAILQIDAATDEDDDEPHSMQ